MMMAMMKAMRVRVLEGVCRGGVEDGGMVIVLWVESVIKGGWVYQQM